MGKKLCNNSKKIFNMYHKNCYSCWLMSDKFRPEILLRCHGHGRGSCRDFPPGRLKIFGNLERPSTSSIVYTRNYMSQQRSSFSKKKIINGFFWISNHSTTTAYCLYQNAKYSALVLHFKETRFKV